jgi:hypothetical protein
MARSARYSDLSGVPSYAGRWSSSSFRFKLVALWTSGAASRALASMFGWIPGSAGSAQLTAARGSAIAKPISPRPGRVRLLPAATPRPELLANPSKHRGGHIAFLPPQQERLEGPVSSCSRWTHYVRTSSFVKGPRHKSSRVFRRAGRCPQAPPPPIVRESSMPTMRRRRPLGSNRYPNGITNERTIHLRIRAKANTRAPHR